MNLSIDEIFIMVKLKGREMCFGITFKSHLLQKKIEFAWFEGSISKNIILKTYYKVYIYFIKYHNTNKIRRKNVIFASLKGIKS